jgi:hypothetical protein
MNLWTSNQHLAVKIFCPMWCSGVKIKLINDEINNVYEKQTTNNNILI